jgi:hypothetical protein
LHCADVSLDGKYCSITPVENMKEVDTDYQRIDQLLKERSVKISPVVWQTLSCIALQSSLRLIRRAYNSYIVPVREETYPNGDN